jgi:hypothetical protein
MPRLLREVGWIVESDEFTEIEDPDPEDHEKRQRELINEIEEARKQLEEKPKSRFNFFRRKKAVGKKEWEMYEEKTKDAAEDTTVTLEGKASGVLFDIDALRAEVADLAAQGIVVKELPESTLPPMKLDLSSPRSSSLDLRPSLEDRSQSAPPVKSSFVTPPDSASLMGPKNGSPAMKLHPVAAVGAAGAIAAGAGIAAAASVHNELERSRPAPSLDSELHRPGLSSAMTAPSVPISLEHNAWADEFEHDFGQEKEPTMSFE